MMRFISGAGLGVLVWAALPMSDALACGGFFCSQTPIDQSAEHVVFAVNPETGLVDAHIQISYAGTAEDFAWVVPVQSIPELFVSTESLFQSLDQSTDPQFWLSSVEEGDCSSSYGGGYYGGYADVALDASSSYGYDDAAAPGVVVIDEKVVGPYDTVTLQATSSDELLTWLQDNNYDLPDKLGPVLEPYIADESYFVALRLASGSDVGDIAPLGMTYAGDQPSIPIQLTSIAALPDMRLQVTVFGKARFVPDSYLHVQINEAAINWLNGGNNYDNVITRAANEAGGHAFATDYAGSTESFRGSVYVEGMYDTDALASITDPAQFVDAMLSQGFPSTALIQDIIRAWIPMPQQAIDAGIDEASFYNCLDCYPEYLALIDFDGAGMADALEELVVEPLRQAERLFSEHPYMSRMTSSLDAAEMTVDPVFVPNFDMGDQSNIHEADLVYMCGPQLYGWWDAPRRIELSDDTIIYVPSEEWISQNDPFMESYQGALTDYAAEVIERTGDEGEPEVLTDNGAAIDDLIAEHNALWAPAGAGLETDGAVGCGCAAGGVPMGVGAFALLLGITGFRRRD